MKNKFFPDEDISENDLYFMCYMVERVARELHQRNKYVVNTMGYNNLYDYMDDVLNYQEVSYET